MFNVKSANERAGAELVAMWPAVDSIKLTAPKEVSGPAPHIMLDPTVACLGEDARSKARNGLSAVISR